jgi:PKHD-type hydroxylase
VEGTVFKFGQLVKQKQFRSVQICNEGISKDLEDRIFKTIFLTNSSSFRLHLEGYDQKDPPLVFKYSADREDHYVWHTDSLPGDSVRKLSFTIQLTDPAEYDGGDLEFMPANIDKKIREQGSMTIFPSFRTHRVSPVTRGVRHSIVGWIYGPDFR